MLHSIIVWQLKRTNVTRKSNCVKKFVSKGDISARIKLDAIGGISNSKRTVNIMSKRINWN